MSVNRRYIEAKLEQYSIETSDADGERECWVCGATNDAAEMVRESGGGREGFTCKPCVAGEIYRNEKRKEGRFDALLR